MEEILAAILGSPAFRAFVVAESIKVFAEIFHRRASDPNFLGSSDTLFVALANATTDEERLSAEKALQALYASPSAS
jgi:hypothetical protein